MKKRRSGHRGHIVWTYCAAGAACLVVATLAWTASRTSTFDEISFEQQSAAIETSFQNQPVLPHAPDALDIPIFIYHSVRPHYAGESKLQDAYDITPELLEQQLAYLRKNGYTAINMDDLTLYVMSGKIPAGMKPVVLTFDDGWQNQYVYAFPLLKKYGMKAVFYVYTDPISVMPHYLTWDELKEMDAAGMQIEDHTLSHPYLKDLSDADIEREMAESKKIIESHVGKPVLHFASPFGYTSERVQALAREVGFVTARTTYKGAFHDKNSLLSLTGFLVTDDIKDFTDALSQAK